MRKLFALAIVAAGLSLLAFSFEAQRGQRGQQARRGRNRVNTTMVFSARPESGKDSEW
jgi:hypothetical protein